ncbi:MAG: hypothetical protein ACE5KU_00965 [Nitrososphaerales archaeon]
MVKRRYKILAIGSCLLFATLMTSAFTAAALQLGKYTQVDIYVGVAWFFVISLIISSPLLLPRIRKRFSQ